MSESLDRFIGEVRKIVQEGGTEEEVTAKVADVMEGCMDDPTLIDPKYMKVNKEKYVLYPVHIEGDGSLSIATAVWDVGQIIPIHDHGSWGVIGIYQGVEHEERFRPPFDGPPERLHEWDAEKGEVFVCCTTDEDCHSVSCGSDIPCVGIHVYGADIGVMERHSYDTETGEMKAFVSGWG